MASNDKHHDAGATLATRVDAALARRGDATVARWKRFGLWQTASGHELAKRIGSIACGLQAVGLAPGEVAAVVGDNSLEWLLADLAIMAAGGVAAGLDAHVDDDVLARQLADSGACVVMAAGETVLRRIQRVRTRCPALRQVVVLHEQWDHAADESQAMPLAALEAAGAGRPAPAATAPDAPALIVFGSAMTGPARGAVLSGRHAGAQAERAAAVLGLTDADERLVMTPLHHVLERVVGAHAALLAGTVLNFPERAETMLLDLAELQPTVVQAAPLVWASLCSSIELNLAETTRLQRWAFRSAHVAGRSRGLGDRLALAPVRARLGLARARLCLSAGAPMRGSTADWFAALGRPLVDLYGSAEAGGMVALGEVGRTVAGVAWRVADDGEVWLRSDAMFSSYADAPDAPVTDAQGWWATGDFGAQGADGLLHVAGRMTELLPGDAGPVVPFGSEQALRASPYVADAFVYRDAVGRICARILLDQDPVVKYAQDRAIPFTHFRSLCQAAGVRDLVATLVSEVNAAQTTLHIEHFSLIERALALGDAELTPVLALRRRLLTEAGVSPKS
jgi:long-chain acyl-CoA synthetase